jgi:hypothetical protein
MLLVDIPSSTKMAAALGAGSLDALQAKEGYGDAIMLDKVSEEAFLLNLKRRYERGKIYTYIGEVRNVRYRSKWIGRCVHEPIQGA